MKRVNHLEAVTICVGYADFLQETAKWNAGLFDRWIIGTTPQDEQTRWVCNRFNLEVILSEDPHRHVRPGGGTFNKGRLIERCLQQTSNEGHRLHLDCDIALPHRFRHLLEAADLQDDTIYGCDRANIVGWAEWMKLRGTSYMQGAQWSYHCQMQFPHGYKVGDRFVHPQMGYIPIGFFQLYHSSQDEWKGIRVKPYPSNHSSAARTDVQFGLKWDRHKRAIIPELIAVHLESEAVKKGTNWNGRQTKWFGPVGEKPPQYGHNKPGSC